MNSNKILIGALTGGIVLFLTGGLFYGVLLKDFMADNAGTASGVMKDSPDLLWLIIGNLAYGYLLSIILGVWANKTTWSDGAKFAALIGLLMAIFFDTMMYATTNLYNMTLMITDIATMTVMSAIGGAAIGYVLGMGKKEA